MTAPLDGKVAIVTGAATGIGFGIVHRLLDDGSRVMLAGLDEAQLNTALGRLDHPAAMVGQFAGDLSVVGVADHLVAMVVDRFGGFDVLVNNAGGGVIIPTLEHTEATLRSTIDNNLWTTLRVTIAALPHMVERGGRIINIGAESVRNGLTDHAVYNAAKGGVHALAIGLAREFAGQGITVNVVAPSYTRTDELDELIRQRRTPARFDKVLEDAISLIPIGRAGEVDEVAAAVAFLAREDSGFITGQVISVNGGSSMN